MLTITMSVRTAHRITKCGLLNEGLSAEATPTRPAQPDFPVLTRIGQPALAGNPRLRDVMRFCAVYGESENSPFI